MSAKMCGGLEGAQRLNSEKEIHPDKIWNGAQGQFTTTPYYQPHDLGRAVREKSGMYNAPVTRPIGPFYVWMERLDRWGYISVGFSLLSVGVGIFVHSWLVFARSVNEHSFLLSSITLVNNLLLVVILLELFRTIVRFLETDILRVEPYLAVGIIACVRRMLTASAELGDLRNVTAEFFANYLKDVALDTITVTLLIIGIFILRVRPTKSDQQDFPLGFEKKP
jgi:uncharacterized membrane protein (DUF373 family)